ncbi:MAG: hypothetical protein P1U39_07955 [Legionellaceae bacterium]|jgi:hypothetical protein|nr:hypothetical protein [Legionellaceae bacterium]
MPPSIKQFLQQLPPFILIGISIALGVGIFIVFSYVLVWGIVIGAILWGANLLIEYLRSAHILPSKKQTKKSTSSSTSTSKGRIIDHEKN